MPSSEKGRGHEGRDASGIVTEYPSRHHDGNMAGGLPTPALRVSCPRGARVPSPKPPRRRAIVDWPSLALATRSASRRREARVKERRSRPRAAQARLPGAASLDRGPSPPYAAASEGQRRVSSNLARRRKVPRFPLNERSERFGGSRSPAGHREETEDERGGGRRYFRLCLPCQTAAISMSSWERR